MDGPHAIGRVAPRSSRRSRQARIAASKAFRQNTRRHYAHQPLAVQGKPISKHERDQSAIGPIGARGAPWTASTFGSRRQAAHRSGRECRAQIPPDRFTQTDLEDRLQHSTVDHHPVLPHRWTPWPLMGFAQLPHRRSRPNISPNHATAHRRPRLTTWGRRTTGKARSTPQTNHYQKRDTVSGITGPRARARRQFCLPYTLVGLKGLEPMTSARPEGTHAIDSRYPPARSHPPAQTRTNGKRSRVRLPAPS